MNDRSTPFATPTQITGSAINYSKITPVILTYNEDCNIARTVAQLYWATEIVVVDSFSEDNTLTILQTDPRVRVVQRRFDCHSAQWNFGITKTHLSTPWVLALDADYVLTEELIEELASIDLDGATSGYQARFLYCVYGRPLRGTIYPPVTVLFRAGVATYRQDGHTQTVDIAGTVRRLRSPILHDDRKSFTRWLNAQDRYSDLEAQLLVDTKFSELSLSDKVRRSLPGIGPFAVFVIAYFGKGVFLDGRAGLFYALQRMIAEAIVTAKFIERRAGWKRFNNHSPLE